MVHFLDHPIDKEISAIRSMPMLVGGVYNLKLKKYFNAMGLRDHPRKQYGDLASLPLPLSLSLGRNVAKHFLDILVTEISDTLCLMLGSITFN